MWAMSGIIQIVNSVYFGISVLIDSVFALEFSHRLLNPSFHSEEHEDVGITDHF